MQGQAKGAWTLGQNLANRLVIVEDRLRKFSNHQMKPNARYSKDTKRRLPLEIEAYVRMDHPGGTPMTDPILITQRD